MADEVERLRLIVAKLLGEIGRIADADIMSVPLGVAEALNDWAGLIEHRRHVPHQEVVFEDDELATLYGIAAEHKLIRTVLTMQPRTSAG